MIRHLPQEHNGAAQPRDRAALQARQGWVHQLGCVVRRWQQCPSAHLRGRRVGGLEKNISNEPVDHALGRSRGGWGSKIHLVTCGNGVPLAATVTAGQSHESRSFESAMDAVRPRRRRPMWVLGDKGYSYPRVRAWCERRGIWDVIPQRSDQLRREGRRVFSPAAYKGRNVVERRAGGSEFGGALVPEKQALRDRTSDLGSRDGGGRARGRRRSR
ncbi:MAG: transposase [Phycisphaerales bacterium]